ncbi:GNAT family N-acetyltransferase [Streptobacillus felis]|uniref:GNAT family N-acetyltransferase n=1 Tax=Streptobacillus felis TaxID=1384509 RepID=A0A7Z0PFZ1_9FUSO|nr:GNAT family N-acetyltransferase [Streptobacillus felis]NYV28008.1 GNAT family N-acetyltransferase [Streptobacillus felis]
MKKIETERLILRRFKVEDAQNMFDNWASIEENVKFLWPVHKNVEETRSLLELWVKEYDEKKCFKWAITLKESPEIVIGDISVVEIKEKIKSADIGYILSKKYWNLGYMSEALEAVINYLFLEEDFNRIEAKYDIRNTASGKVMEKAGMKFEGILRESVLSNSGIGDLAVCSILRKEYMK